MILLTVLFDGWSLFSNVDRSKEMTVLARVGDWVNEVLRVSYREDWLLEWCRGGIEDCKMIASGLISGQVEKRKEGRKRSKVSRGGNPVLCPYAVNLAWARTVLE